ncbi:hypothetical protein [Pannonibacter sp. P2PFMT1]|uniref:hypothetical protein n=1 Tax=Pannonibacter sp. P2PFMT1 TaxID=2003582 RepID=UPI0016484BC3|nr:hypothetical protein [Pannonibacter sp. P2PFMT1]
MIAEVVDFDPGTRFDLAIAALFVPASAAMVYMARLTDGDWVAPPPPDPIPEPAPYEPPAPVLPPLTRRQLRLALLSIGVTAEDVEAHIAAITDPAEQAAALIEWRDSNTYDRGHPLVADIAAAMDLPPEQVDSLWAWAAGI